MRTTMAGFTSFPSLLLISSLLLASYGAACASKVQASVTIVDGLSWTFYNSSCPELESIVRTHLKTVFEKDIGQAAGLLRLHFHDCFVQVTKRSSNIFIYVRQLDPRLFQLLCCR